MAGDWIKVEKSTPGKPEIATLARKLGISRGEAFLSWFAVYSWADSITCPDFVPNLSLSEADELSHAKPGTCEALASKEIGWMERIDGDPAGIRFVNWERHNGKSAKARGLEAEKKRKQRAKAVDLSRKCPDDSGTKSGPEKRREENIDKETKAKKVKGFIPPTVAEVAAYCSERKNRIDAESFVAHYTANGWKVGKAAMKDWRAAIITWEKNRKPDAAHTLPFAN